MKKSENASDRDSDFIHFPHTNYCTFHYRHSDSDRPTFTLGAEEEGDMQDKRQKSYDHDQNLVDGRSFWSANWMATRTVTSLCGCASASSPSSLPSSTLLFNDHIYKISGFGFNKKGFKDMDVRMSMRMMPSLTFVWAVTTVVAALLTLLTPVHSFNIDVPSVLTHRGPSSSMFGFSVAQHRDSNISW